MSAAHDQPLAFDSAQRFCHAHDINAEPGLFVDPPGAFIARKDGELQVAILVFAGPSLGVGEQRAADAFAIVLLVDRQIRNMAVLAVAEEILDGLQMNEADALTVVIFRDEDMRARRLLGQVAGDIELNMLGAFSASPPRG